MLNTENNAGAAVVTPSAPFNGSPLGFPTHTPILYCSVLPIAHASRLDQLVPVFQASTGRTCCETPQLNCAGGVNPVKVFQVIQAASSLTNLRPLTALFLLFLGFSLVSGFLKISGLTQP